MAATSSSLNRDIYQAKHAALQARAALLRAARIDGAAFTAFVLRDEQTGKSIELADIHVEWHELIDEWSRIIIWSSPELGKALALETPIPTPTGWTTMGALRAGDTVFDSKGKPCAVTFATPVMHGHAVYRVTFDDGETIDADADHQWIVKTERRYTPKAPSTSHVGDGDPCACGCGMRAKTGKRYVHNHHRQAGDPRVARVVTTAQMLAAGVMIQEGKNRRSRWRIPLAGPVQFGHRPLPIAPYVLGAWLGDGDSSGPTITCHEDDRETIDRCAALEGGRIHESRDPRRPTTIRARIGSDHHARGPRDGSKLCTRLRLLGVLNNKHIPDAYLTASDQQRRELLAGLLDTDGTVTDVGYVSFDNMNERLARQVGELARSLGLKVSIRSKTVYAPQGHECGLCWTVSFVSGSPVFHLARKRAKHGVREPFGRANYRTIVSIDPIESKPVKCISVESADESYLAGRDFTVTHNTSQVAIGRTLFELGKDSTKRIVILSRTQGQSVKVIRSIASYIERSSELREVFPNLYPSVPWTSTALMIQREVFSKDFSVQACGVGGAILGSRVDILVIDDILDWKNTRTPAQRQELMRWFKSEFLGRLTADCKVIVCGNAYHPEDFLHALSREDGYVARTYPASLPDGEPAFPRKWSRERIAAKRKELGPLEAARQLDCVARKDSDSRCKEEWIRTCLARGDGIPLYRALQAAAFAELGILTFTGVDIGVGKSKKDAKTVVTTIAVWPNGDLQVIAMDHGRWSGLEIVQNAVAHHVRFSSIVYVESNAAQRHLVDFAREVLVDGVKVPSAQNCIVPFNTGGNKTHPVFGVEGVFAEFQMGKWVIPSNADPNRQGFFQCSEAINEWLSECENYDPTMHTGDHLMSVWIARQGAREFMKTREGVQNQVVSARVVGDGANAEMTPERAEALTGWEVALQKAEGLEPE